jgi:hypothetical protein
MSFMMAISRLTALSMAGLAERYALLIILIATCSPVTRCMPNFTRPERRVNVLIDDMGKRRFLARATIIVVL